MIIKVSLNLDIQIQYLAILKDFLDSEHTALQCGQVYDVYQLEKSIHGILKTLQEKRLEMRDDLMGVSVREFASECPRYAGDMLRGKIERLSRLEEVCLQKASRNADLSMILAGKKMAAPEHWNVFPGDTAIEGRVQ